MEKFESNINDPRVYNPKFSKYSKRCKDHDSTTFYQVIFGIEAGEYIETMKEEITDLKHMKTWIMVDREPNMIVLKGTCAFKLKLIPDSVVYMHRSSFRVRGDQEEYGVNYFETFTPVVHWGTIRLLLILILTNHWTTQIIDYKNVFSQANIDTDIYVKLPVLFSRKSGKDKVLKLKKVGIHEETNDLCHLC